MGFMCGGWAPSELNQVIASARGALAPGWSRGHSAKASFRPEPCVLRESLAYLLVALEPGLRLSGASLLSPWDGAAQDVCGKQRYDAKWGEARRWE